MKLETHSFNGKLEAVKYMNSHGISKDSVLSFFQEKDGTYTVMYYVEE